MAQSGQSQIIEHLMEMKEDIAVIKGIVPTVKEIDKVVRIGNGKAALTTRMEILEADKKSRDDCIKEKKDDQKWFKRTVIGALVVQFIVIGINYFK